MGTFCSTRGVSFEAMEVRRLFAVGLVSDAAGLGPSESVTIDGTSYFFADNGLTGRELWRSDGTAIGTTLVKDLTPGAAASKLLSMSHAGDRAVFVTVADEREDDIMSSADYTFWSSDGTAGGTIQLAHFDNAFMVSLKQAGDRVAFAVTVRNPGGMFGSYHLTDALLCFTDGTANGTKLVKTFKADVNSPSGIPTRIIAAMYAAGDRVVFTPDDFALWSSDGTTGGTVDLTPAAGDLGLQFQSSSSNMTEAGGKVIIPSAYGGRVVATDGTPQGTVSRSFHVSGGLQGMSSFVFDGGYYFIEISGESKALWRMDLDSGKLTAAYRTEGDASDNSILPAVAGEQLYLIDSTTERGVGATIYLIGEDGPSEVGHVPASAGVWIDRHAAVDGVLYFVATQYYGDEVGDGSGNYLIELWRCDGTSDGTGRARLLYDGPRPAPAVSVTAVDGKLAVKQTYYRMVPVELEEGGVGHREEETGSETIVYDPRELQIGREGASARFANGVLRIFGSLADDRIRLWRSVRMPDKLVVEYNGNYRSFPFADVAKIIIDLQDGNDRVEFLEEEGGLLRMRTSVFGGDGTDTIFTGTGRDTIIGGNGGDYIRTRGNADMIIGGSGRDSINGGQGDDVIAGGTGNDSVLGGEGSDVLFGQLAIERAFGTVWESLEDLEDDLVLLPP